LIDAMRSRFLGRFLEVSSGRLVRARALLESGDPTSLAHELHALSGEARMLELHDVADDAGRGERAARHWASGAADEGRPECARALATLADAVIALGRQAAVGGTS